MPVRLTTAVGVATLVLLGSGAARVNNSGIPSTLDLAVDPSFNLTESDQDDIRKELRDKFDFERQKSAWKCVQAFSKTTNENRVKVLVKIEKNIQRDEDATVTATIEYRRSTLGTKSNVVGGSVFRDSHNPKGAFAAEAGRALTDALAQGGPCDPKASLKAKTRMDMRVPEGTGLLESNFEGEAQLLIIDDGSFSATMPVQMHNLGGYMRGQGGACTFPPFETSFTFDLAGNYDDSDGTLRFSRMNGHDMQGSTAGGTCTAAGHTVSTGPQPFGQPMSGEYTATHVIRIALENHAHAVLPTDSFPYITQEFTLDLTFGMAAVSRPIDRGRQ